MHEADGAHLAERLCPRLYVACHYRAYEREDDEDEHPPVSVVNNQPREDSEFGISVQRRIEQRPCGVGSAGQPRHGPVEGIQEPGEEQRQPSMENETRAEKETGGKGGGEPEKGEGVRRYARPEDGTDAFSMTA